MESKILFSPRIGTRFRQTSLEIFLCLTKEGTLSMIDQPFKQGTKMQQTKLRSFLKMEVVSGFSLSLV